jgi:large subunit ribosomal protein L18
VAVAGEAAILSIEWNEGDTMSNRNESRGYSRRHRHRRVRKKVIGTPERPRFAVFKSSRHIYAQLIDDTAGVTLLGASSISPVIKDSVNGKSGKIETSKVTGKFLAEKAAGVGIRKVVFDRGGYKYHGRVKALADGARDGGLEF